MYLETLVIYVIEVTYFKSEVRVGLWGCFEAEVALEAAKRAHTM